ncbi:hypothetical protein, partial [Stutzerimonas kunmingensis]|uniref:hypothetical protein n=1 Tax=Stutzerimonas kunmingensis TaxID=1211807 RepID=UPI0028A817EA
RNAKVAGSTPVSGTNEIKGLASASPFLFVVDLPHHPLVISVRLHYLLSRLVGFQARKECVVV